MKREKKATNLCNYNTTTYLVNTGSCEPITLKRANNSPIVVRSRTHKRFFVSDVQVPDGNIKLFPLTMQRRQCTIFRIEICMYMSSS